MRISWHILVKRSRVLTVLVGILFVLMGIVVNEWSLEPLAS